MGLDDYALPTLLTEEGYVKGYVAISKDTRQFVSMKVIEDDICEREHLARKVKDLCKIKHPNIVQTLDSFHIANGFCIVTECSTNGDLVDFGGGCSLSKLQNIAKQLLEGLGHLHSENIAHCNLKPPNILMFAGGVFKICDPGLAPLMMENVNLQSLAGSINFITIFAATGAISSHYLFQLFFGHLPPNRGSTIKDVLLWHSEVDQVKCPANMNVNLSNFIECMLTKNPASRSTCEDLLKHKFITETYKETVPYDKFRELLHVTGTLIHRKDLNDNKQLLKCFRSLHQLAIKHADWFVDSSTTHWASIVGLFQDVAGSEEVASGQILYESICCINVIFSQVAQDAFEGIMVHAKRAGLLSTLLLCLKPRFGSRESDILPAASEACMAIWIMLSAYEKKDQYDQTIARALSFENRKIYKFDVSYIDNCKEIRHAVTTAFLHYKDVQLAFNLCLNHPDERIWSSVIKIILRCCLNGEVRFVVCGLSISLGATKIIKGGDENTIVSTIFSKLSFYASLDKDLNSEQANLISDLCLVLTTVAQALRGMGKQSVACMLTLSPTTQYSRLSDLANLNSRLQDSTPYVMLALAAILTLGSILEIARPLLINITMLDDYLKISLTKDGIGRKFSIWHGFMDGVVGMLEANLRYGGTSAIQQLCSRYLPETLIYLLKKNLYFSLRNSICLSPFGVIWTISVLYQCLVSGTSAFHQRFLTVKNLEVISGVISDVNLQLISSWGGHGGRKSGVIQMVRWVVTLLKFPLVQQHVDRKAYAVALGKAIIPGKIVKCLKHVDLKDAAGPVAFLARMTRDPSIVSLLDKGLFDQLILRKLLCGSSTREVTLDVLRIVSDLVPINKVFCEHVESTEIVPFIKDFFKHEHPDVRSLVCHIISSMCMEGDNFYTSLKEHKIIPLLVDCYYDQDERTRYNAGVAIVTTACHNDLLHKQLRRCIPQIKWVLLSAEENDKAKMDACSILQCLVQFSDKLCSYIVTEGAMEALLKLVVNFPANLHKELLQEIATSALRALCKHPTCKVSIPLHYTQYPAILEALALT